MAEIRPVGPNEHCPCGSGRKYKKCHGRVVAKPSNRWLPLGVLLVLVVLGATAYFLNSKAPGVVPGGSAAGAPARMGTPWEYDAASNTHFDPSPGHNHWHAGPPPAGR